MPDQPQMFKFGDISFQGGGGFEVFQPHGSVVFEATDPTRPGVRYVGELAEINGRTELVTLVFRADPGHFLRSADLRTLRFHALVTQARRRVFTAAKALEPHGVVGWNLSRLRQAASATPLKRGRAGYPAEHYRRIARAYLTLVQGESSKHAMRRLAKAEDRPVETVRTWVARARRDGFLSPTRQGLAGAEPGPNLEEES
ncbi:MAG: hypothetical protein M3P96_05360 [Actinomycetota bacterium]|nr:hypothetical protein [Actinomycetota bacterium]